MAEAAPSGMYDQFAEAYAADNEGNATNALYERPAMLALIGELNGKRVLDAGCGAGALAEMMLERGAHVTGLEISESMANLARGRMGSRASVHLADLAQPLTMCDDESFDVVAASLVLHYIEDWSPTLEEFWRVLVPGGILAISTHHPTMDWRRTGGSYFETRLITETWRKRGVSATVMFWRRPLTAMMTAFRAARFVVDDIVEPMPVPDCAGRFPREYIQLTTAPRFLFVRLKKAG
jgi:ubiquinone/menaquinone biosynthesis C-methylase UbiE